MARSGGLSYVNASIHVPELLALTDKDHMMFNGNSPPSRSSLLKCVCKMGSFLELVKVRLGEPDIFRGVIERFLAELSLPEGLCREIMRAFANTELFDFTSELLPLKKKEVISNIKTLECRKVEDTPTMEVRALGLILFALKYVYGLDDDAENCEAAASSPSSDFNISDWMRLSRHRAFWACKKTHILRY